MVGTEAALVSAVISGTLKIVGNKLVPLITKEYSSIVGVKKDLEELHGLVEEINWCLAGDKASRNYPSFSWLKQLKDVSHGVDDLVDEFYLEAEKHEANGGSGRHNVFKYLLTELKSFMFQCKAAQMLKAIKKRFAAIVKQRTDFSAIANSVPVDHPVQHINKTTEEMPSLPNVDEASVFGREQERSQIISKLVEANDQQKIKIVSIVGLGGSGKTTLAKLVFNDGNIIEKHFEVILWVHVSHEFDVAKLIGKLFETIAVEKAERYPLQQMSKIISDKLTGKRYMLILDDVWTEDRNQWEQFMVHLKSDTPGSRILLTTRNSKVAETVGSLDQFDLPLLSENESWQLFQQSLVMAANGLDLEFVEVGKEIVKKCGGLPLAIKVLAGSLHDKEQIEEWRTMRDSNFLDVESQELSLSVSACLSLSYLHLPSYLKPCFTISSMFPKGLNIDKEQLIDLWIAHDMITLVAGVDFLKYIGHKCFNSLVQRSFLQEVSEYHGKVKCRMNDLLHDFAGSILGDEISLVVPQEADSFTKSYRYSSLTEQPRNLLPKNIFKKARDVYVGDGESIIFGKSLNNARHLRSITVVNASVLTPILQIRNLRYLSMPWLNCEILPEAISDIWSLQALHLLFSNLLELPKSIGKLQRLRSLDLSWSQRLKSLPDSIGDCHMISTIDLSYCGHITVLPNSMERNTSLRVLRLGSTQIKRLPPGITTLGHLECLYLNGCSSLVELLDGIGKLKKLEILNLRDCGNVKSMPVGFRQLTRRQMLDSFIVGEDEKSAPILELGNIARISGELSIRNIAGVMQPDDARKAYLKKMINLQSLTLDWGMNYGVNFF